MCSLCGPNALRVSEFFIEKECCRCAGSPACWRAVKVSKHVCKNVCKDGCKDVCKNV